MAPKKPDAAVRFEDVPADVLAAETASETAAPVSATEKEPCLPVTRADGERDCGASHCDFRTGRTACGLQV